MGGGSLEGGRNFGEPLAGSAGCPRPTPGHHAPLGATVCGGRVYPALASGMGKFGLSRTPLKDSACPADRALPPSSELWTRAILEGEREGAGERSGEDLAVTAGGRLRIRFLEDPASPPSPNPADRPAAGTASAPRSRSSPGGDSDLTPRVPRIGRPGKRQHFRVASTEVDSGRQRPQSAHGEARAWRPGRSVVALFPVASSGGPSGGKTLPLPPHPRVNLGWAPAASSLGAWVAELRNQGL